MLLDLKEAAKRLGMSYETARDYTVTGALKSVRFPSLTRPGELRRRIQIREEDLEDFIQEHLRVGPETGPLSVQERVKMAPSKRDQKKTTRRNLNWMQRYGG